MWTFSILLQKTLPQNNDCVGWSKINACICFWCTLASEDYDGSANSQYIFLIPLVTKIIVTCFPCNGAPGGWSTPTVEPADRWAHQRRAGPHRPAADPDKGLDLGKGGMRTRIQNGLSGVPGWRARGAARSLYTVWAKSGVETTVG